MRVFIADDAAFIREFMKSLFKKMGAQVVGEAENGEEVLQRLPRTLPDLLVMDVVMPLMSGKDALKILRPQYPHIKVLICTTLALDVALDPKLFDARLNKPFNLSEFKEALISLGFTKGAQDGSYETGS